MKSILFSALVLLVFATTANVYASGPRLDSGDDVTQEEHDCWVDGYDSGFAGKYDSDRARECIDHSDNYSQMWTYACESAPRSEQQCIDIMNNPVEIQDYEALLEENKTDCYYDGQDNGTEDKPYNKERAKGCEDASGDYKEGYEFGCQTINTESECALRIEGEKNYCPNHPNIVACVDFLHNATNKVQGKALTDTVCAQSFVTCLHESNPERYCMNTNDPVF